MNNRLIKMIKRPDGIKTNSAHSEDSEAYIPREEVKPQDSENRQSTNNDKA